MKAYTRPAQLQLSVTFDHERAECPACRSEEVYTYPVLSEGGWWRVTKCRRCLHSVARERLPLLGAIDNQRGLV